MPQNGRPRPLPLDEIVQGDALKTLRQFPADAVDCLVTSPPYWRQRNYRGDNSQIGQERTPEEYVNRLAEVFDEARRVLKPSGTAWLVIGDKYFDGKQLGLPWRVALALIDRGWILRADCIWHKPNAMPSPSRSRPTPDHEYVFFFVKSDDYAYDSDAIREPHVTFSAHSKMRGGRGHFGVRGGTPEAGKNGGTSNLHDGRWDQAFHPLGRNKRTVWSIPLSKYRGAHFAVFPESLIETCLRAGCPDQGMVLDPFSGSGTTAVVARRLGRHFVGIDCVAEYCQMARQRLASADPAAKAENTGKPRTQRVAQYPPRA